MIRLFALAAVATVAVPVLVPYRFGAEFFPETWWAPLLLLCGEVILTALVFKFLYPSNDFVRCLTTGLAFFLARLVFCLFASVLDPDADRLRLNMVGGAGNAFVVAMTYMYAVWWVALAQYVAMLLWVPSFLEAVLPGIFPPRRKEGEVGRVEPRPSETGFGEPEAARAVQPRPVTFRDLESELARYPGLVAWVVFSPENLPVWRWGEEAGALEAVPEIARRIAEICEPLFRPEWGRTIRQGLLQTDGGYCLMTVLPGGFLFSSLWASEQQAERARDLLPVVLERMERWLGYRFGESS